jgi:hypothetical protein
MFDLGDTVPLSVLVCDPDGHPTNATSVVLTVGLPDGTTETPTVANATAGSYTVDYVPAGAGRYTASWVSTSPATAFVDVFDVRPAAPAYLVSLADMKAHLNMTSTANDEELRSHIEAATSVIEDAVGEVIVRRTVVEDRDISSGRVAAVVTSTPVISLTSVVRVDGSQTWDVDDLSVSPAGIVSVNSGAGLGGRVRFTYVAGYQQIPARLSMAAKELVRSTWESQRGKTVATRAVNNPDLDGFVTMGGRLLPPHVADLIGPRGPLVG